ncbi:MAG: 3-deoxy-8-phosphooctulonate synthase, partial [Acidobacteria bacterium]|nr:3-deoxy-8-phosphooctulonate synthase [Acidobacteriota bacterium]
MSEHQPIFVGGSVGGVPAGGGASLFLIAGPCVIESDEHVLRMADAISKITSRLKLPLIFKSSFD